MSLMRALAVVGLLAFAGSGAAQYPEWKRSGSVFILTTPAGANLPDSAVVENFPLLLRLHKQFFDFAEAQANGEDFRVSSARGEPLAYQIDEWDAARGVASIWVRVPKIVGNSRQELKLFWGNADAKPQSDGKAVFNDSNGYLSVWHMNGVIQDETGNLTSKDTGTSSVPGAIGSARRFPGQKGIFGGDTKSSYPTGAGSHSTEAWFRADRPNGNVVAWGNEHGQGKVVMQYRSPASINMDCYFSAANVATKSPVPGSQWTHVVHTYEKGDSRIYVNGSLDGTSQSAGAPLAIKSPARLWIGGWYDNYNFVGDIDEVRISKVVRSADWIRLQYENQKPMQTLVGHLVRPGADFGVSETEVTIPEGASRTFEAKAGGADKVYWSIERDGKETVLATDRLALTFDAGRVVGDQSALIRFKAVYPAETKTREIRVTIREAIPEPIFTLEAPATWDGRKTIEVVPRIANLEEMRAKGAERVNVTWSVADLATIREVAPGKLILKRSQNSGPMTVTAAIENGGKAISQSVTIQVKEPAADSWVERKPGKDERPVDGQFYARDDSNEGTLHCNGVLTGPADTVFLNVFADDKPYKSVSQKPAGDGSYALAVKLKPGLIKYRVECGSKTGEVTTVLYRAGDIVCGDAYLINGQSNAVATDFGKEDPPFRSEWIRSFGSMANSPRGSDEWGGAVHRSRDGGKYQIGYWGMELGRRLVESQKIPIFLINGAVGGTRIDEHQRNPINPEDRGTIYGRLLERVRKAGLTHGIRGVLWHQGENDQGADGPTGGYGWETYQQYFIDLAAAWKQDYPNIQHYYVFQIWPKACAMGIKGSDNRLREVQRNLPKAFSNLHVMSTLGIDPPGGCHFPAAGYAEFARLIVPLVERDFYGQKPAASITPPNLMRAAFTSEKKDAIALEFDQPVKWDDALAGQFYLDGQRGKVLSGSAEGGRVTLKLADAPAARTVTYLDGASWSQKTLLKGLNGIAALTFSDVPIQDHKP